MLFYQAKSPSEYQNFFYSNTGLTQVIHNEQCNSWEDSNNSYIHTYGSLSTTQFGVGNYTLPNTISINFNYSDSYLHFGIVYQGVTHTIINNVEEVKSTPSTFLAIDYNPSGTNFWKKGQGFHGTEVSIHLDYLKNILLPILGVDIDSIDYLQKNIRHNLTDEMKRTLQRVESLLIQKKITSALLTAISLDLIAQLLHPDVKSVLQQYKPKENEYVSLGNRKLLFTRDDFAKVIEAHSILSNSASNFPTVFTLSKDLSISEQKLKCGFFHLYKQTIWEYANHIRMNQAVKLLEDNSNTISSISKEVGYQSQAAFINMFKKWAGICPSAFRARLLKQNSQID